jgi:hypothetical protein
MSDLGTKLVCLGEATVQEKIVQTWAEAKEKVTSLLDLKLYPVSATPEQGRAMEEGRALIVEDEVTEAEKRYEYCSNREYCDFCVCCGSPYKLAFFAMLFYVLVGISGIFLENEALCIVTAAIIECCLCLFTSEVIRVMVMYRAKKGIEAAKERTRVSAEVMAEAAEVINSAWAATQLWYQAKGETLKKLLIVNDTPQIREEVIPAFFGIVDATKAWENAKLVCQQAIANITDRSSRIAEEAKRISEAVTAAEVTAREAEEMLCQAISHIIIPTHNDSTESKSELVIEKQ